MLAKSTYLILLISVFFCSAGAQNTPHVPDSLAHRLDSAWLLDRSAEFNLTVPSYEEMLEVYFESVVTVDQHLRFNPYRFQQSRLETVNPFVYSSVILPENQLPNLEAYATGFATKNPFEKDAYQIWQESRSYLSASQPKLINSTWRMIPDAPRVKETQHIRTAAPNFSEIEKRRQRIMRPQKIEKQKRIHQPWNVKIVSMLNANQTAFLNWDKGGVNSFSLSGRVVADADYVSRDKKTRWANDAEFRLGYLRQEDKPLVKDLDLFRINTQLARNAVNKWFYALSAEFSSQFFDGYDLKKDIFDDPISSFLAPAYLKMDVGMDYKIETEKNKKLFSLQASPFSYKLTYVKDTAKINQTKFGIEEDKKGRQELGGSLKLISEYAYKQKLAGKSQLLFFSNYMENPQNVDINWNTTLTYHFSRIFSVTFTLDLIYDDDADILLRKAADGSEIYGQRLQMKEFLGFGLTYRLR